MATPILITEDAWGRAPEEASERFLYLAEAARTRLRRVLAVKLNTIGDDAPDSWREQYVNEVSALAKHLGFDNLPEKMPTESFSEYVYRFDTELKRVLVSIRLSRNEYSPLDNFNATEETKNEIRNYLYVLSDIVRQGSLEEKVRKSLLKKIDEALAEIDKSKFSIKPMYLLAGMISVVLATSTISSGVADLPLALQNVQTLLGRVVEESSEISDREQHNNNNNFNEIKGSELLRLPSADLPVSP